MSRHEKQVSLVLRLQPDESHGTRRTNAHTYGVLRMATLRPLTLASDYPPTQLQIADNPTPARAQIFS